MKNEKSRFCLSILFCADLKLIRRIEIIKILMKNNKGANTESCGTPQELNSVLEIYMGRLVLSCLPSIFKI